jgi:hypothetical protein
MLHRKAEIEKQHFRKEGLRKRIISSPICHPLGKAFLFPGPLRRLVKSVDLTP